MWRYFSRCRAASSGCRPLRSLLVLGRSARAHPLLDLGRPVRDLGEADDRDDVVHLHLAAVDLLQEVDHLVEPPELRIVVLDVARREVLDLLDLHAVDDRLEDLLPWRVLEADGDHHDLALAVLLALVANEDRGGLADAIKMVPEDRLVE